MQTYDWLSQGENIIFESAASKVWNVKGINLGGNKGGKLILTDKQLVFQAYVFNIGTRLDKIPLENITGTAKTFNPLVPNPNMIKVETRLGEKFEFTFWKKDKEKWLEIIPKAVSEFKSRQGNTSNACSVDTSDKMLFAFVRYVALNLWKKEKILLKRKYLVRSAMWLSIKV